MKGFVETNLKPFTPIGLVADAMYCTLEPRTFHAGYWFLIYRNFTQSNRAVLTSASKCTMSKTIPTR